MPIAVPRRLSASGPVARGSVILGAALAASGYLYSGSLPVAVLLYALGHLMASGGLRELPIVGPLTTIPFRCRRCGARPSPWKRPTILRSTAAASTIASFEEALNSSDSVTLTLRGAEAYLGVHPEACEVKRVAVVTSLPPEVERGWGLRMTPDGGLLLMGAERLQEGEAISLVRRRILGVETSLALTPRSKVERLAALRGELEELRQLLALLSQRRASMFRLRVVLASDSPLTAAVEAARSMGFGVRYLGRGRPCAYLAGPAPVVHTPVISSSYAFGWGPPCHGGGVLLGTVEGAPLRLDLWSLPSHNILVTGETGSGKTFFAKLLLSRLLKSGLESATILDPLGDYGPLVRAMGGEVVRLEAGWVPDVLGLGEGEEGASNAEILLSAISDARPEEAAAIRVAARRAGGSLRRMMEELRETAPRIARVLEKFGGGRGVPAPSARLVSYDLSAIPEGDLTAALTFLALELKRRSRGGGRKMIIVDEAWFLLANRYATAALASLARHIRHQGGSLLTITQSANDLMAGREAAAVVRNSYIQVHFRQRMEPQTATLLGVDGERLQRLPSLPGGARGTPSMALFLMGDYSMWVRIEASQAELELLEPG